MTKYCIIHKRFIIKINNWIKFQWLIDDTWKTYAYNLSKSVSKVKSDCKSQLIRSVKYSLTF